MLSYFWKSSSTAKENADPILALREALDEHEEFHMLNETTMKFDDFAHMRTICQRQAFRKADQSKEKYDKTRLEAFKGKDQQGYAKCVNEQLTALKECEKEMVREACTHLGIDGKVISASQNHHMQDQ